MGKMGDQHKIKKTVLHAGTTYTPLNDGDRVTFHFQTRKCDDNKTVIDDSRKNGQPMTLVLGKKFKLEVWESIVKQMSVNEVASFVVDKSLVLTYPLVAKTLRDCKNEAYKRRPRHCTGHFFHGLEYDDLDELMKNPCDLEFIIELISVEHSNEYEHETWQLNEEDRILQIPKLREEGNSLYKSKQYEKAAEKYSRAIGFLEQLMLSEKPRASEWNELNKQKLPLLLNFAQCKLVLKEYYEVIEHCSSVLEFEPDNVKALYRRGKAHAAVWNGKEAKDDLTKALRLDPSLEKDITNQLKAIEIQNRERESVMKEKLQGKLF
ncbi:aryl-hydrocarbon-interacting protein-like 1 [Cimex lectularius]|uniref:AIP/AIPL N-terminal FKBP-type PPIase domain-containing protein n=1 Tax=Cimex lectularius TaxID=79782 RepID=A0A8I6RA62_CIMLE|nr:aryl-hydrocarbon-interacting protein-like 1 [Cimex lectularius]